MKLSQIKAYLRRPYLVEDIHTAQQLCSPTKRATLKRLERLVIRARKLYGYAEHSPNGWDVSFADGRFIPAAQ